MHQEGRAGGEVPRASRQRPVPDLIVDALILQRGGDPRGAGRRLDRIQGGEGMLPVRLLRLRILAEQDPVEFLKHALKLKGAGIL